MAPSWLSCCVARPTADAVDALPLRAHGRASSNSLEFFDCCESLTELDAFAAVANGRPTAGREPGAPLLLPIMAASRRPGLEKGPLGSAQMGYVSAFTGAADACPAELTGEMAEAAKVLEQTRSEWSRRDRDLHRDALADQWANLSQAHRMLKANIGDVPKAVAMFLQALEIRTRDRELFESMSCEVKSDMHIIGSDNSERPVVYLCAGSQTEPLAYIRDQFVLTFEQACRLSEKTPRGEGRLYFVLDMHGLQTRLNTDTAALKDLAAILGTVFAERIHKIVIVDFSRAAQAAWWVIKQLLSEVTRNKFAFVGTAAALEQIGQDCDGETLEKMRRTFEVNRDPASSPVERLDHARRTATDLVPLGPPTC